jgi:hypothetical protein
MATIKKRVRIGLIQSSDGKNNVTAWEEETGEKQRAWRAGC